VAILLKSRRKSQPAWSTSETRYLRLSGKRRWTATSAGVIALTLPSLGFALDGGSEAQTAVPCGKERWAVKTLTDARAKKVNFRPKTTTVRSLRSRKVPKRRTLRNQGVESSTYRVRAALIVANSRATTTCIWSLPILGRSTRR
jgi:hypothetical protein